MSDLVKIIKCCPVCGGGKEHIGNVYPVVDIVPVPPGMLLPCECCQYEQEMSALIVTPDCRPNTGWPIQYVKFIGNMEDKPLEEILYAPSN